MSETGALDQVVFKERGGGDASRPSDSRIIHLVEGDRDIRLSLGNRCRVGPSYDGIDCMSIT